jgi:hypothetical protein
MKKKSKIVYLEDKGDTIYSMAALEGRTPEEQEEYDKKRKSRITATSKERWAMLRAAIEVYGPVLIICIGSFAVAALLLYLFLR